jgi:hypothetical protein
MKSTAFGSARGSTLSIHWSVWPAGGPGLGDKARS